jgi:hypothetical protein
MSGNINEVGGIIVKLPFVAVGSHTASTSATTAAASVTVPAGATQWLVQAKNQNFNFTLDGATTATTAMGFLLSTSLPCPIFFPVKPGQVISWIPVSSASTPTLCYQFGKEE